MELNPSPDWVCHGSTYAGPWYCFGPAAKIKREQFPELANKKGNFVADDFTGNSSNVCGEDYLKKVWAEQNNWCLPLKKKGGWSAKGQTADAIFDKSK